MAFRSLPVRDAARLARIVDAGRQRTPARIRKHTLRRLVEAIAAPKLFTPAAKADLAAPPVDCYAPPPVGGRASRALPQITAPRERIAMMPRYRYLVAGAAALTLCMARPAVAQQPAAEQSSSYNQQAYTPAAPATADLAASVYGPPQQQSPLGAPMAAPGPGAPAQPGAAPVQPMGPPFQIDNVEQQFVMQVLQMWEAESSKVNTFNADFERWEYDAVWGPGQDKALIKSTGTLSYSKPDKGSFKIDQINRWVKKDPQDTLPDAAGDYVLQKEEVGEHWVCDGKAVYEYNHRTKQLVVTPIPEQMRGQSIVDGPLPFLFGAEATKLMDRYWIRSKQGNAQQLWLEAYPKRQNDAANYDHVEVILDRKTMQPMAIQVHLPGQRGPDGKTPQRHVYMFHEPTINGTMEAWFGKLFSAPRTPLGWTRVVQQDPAAPAPQAANPAAPVQR
jgi:TIGR03009 family protein